MIPLQLQILYCSILVLMATCLYITGTDSRIKTIELGGIWNGDMYDDHVQKTGSVRLLAYMHRTGSGNPR